MLNLKHKKNNYTHHPVNLTHAANDHYFTHPVNLILFNRDTTQTNKDIFKTKRQQGNIDLTIDTRLFSKDGRNSILEDVERIKRTGKALYDVASKKSFIFQDTLAHIDETQKDLDVQKALALSGKGKLIEILQGKTSTPEEKNTAIKQYAKIYANMFDVEMDAAIIATTKVIGGTTYTNAAKTRSNIDINDNAQRNATNYAFMMGHEGAHVRMRQGKIRPRKAENIEEYADTMGEYSADGMVFSSYTYNGVVLNRNEQTNIYKRDQAGNAILASNNKAWQANIAKAKQKNGVMDFRQLALREVEMINKTAETYAVKYKVDINAARKELTQQALKMTDAKWASKTYIKENTRARAVLEEISQKETPLSLFAEGNGWLDSKKIALFTADKKDFNNPYLFANDTFAIERDIPTNPRTGKEYLGQVPLELRRYISLYGTANGEMPLGEVSGTEQIDEIGRKADNAWDGLSAAYKKEGALGLTGKVIEGVITSTYELGADCATRGIKCGIPDIINNGTAAQQALIDRLQGDRVSQVSHEADGTITGLEIFGAVATAGGGSLILQSGKQATKEGLDQATNVAKYDLVVPITAPSYLIDAPKWKTPEMKGKPIFSTTSDEGLILEQAIDISYQIDKVTGKVKPGGFFTDPNTILNEKYVRDNLAVTHLMKENVTHVAKFRFPANIRIQNSTVGSQIDIDGNVLKGNTPQIEILNYKDRQKIELIELREIIK